MEKDFFVGILNQRAHTPKSTISVCCFSYGSVSNPPTRLIDLNVCILLRHPPLPAVQRDMLKLNLPFSANRLLPPARPSVFISPTPSHLPPHPLCLPFRRRSRGRGFALITDLLYKPVNRDRDALLTPPLAHCHIPSIPALLSKPVHQGTHKHACDWGLFLIVWQYLRECSQIQRAHVAAVRYAKLIRQCLSCLTQKKKEKMTQTLWKTLSWKRGHRVSECVINKFNLKLRGIQSREKLEQNVSGWCVQAERGRRSKKWRDVPAFFCSFYSQWCSRENLMLPLEKTGKIIHG